MNDAILQVPARPLFDHSHYVLELIVMQLQIAETEPVCYTKFRGKKIYLKGELSTFYLLSA